LHHFSPGDQRRRSILGYHLPHHAFYDFQRPLPGQFIFFKALELIMNPLDHLFEPGGQPVRRNGKFQVTLDENGVLRIVAVEADATTVSPSGSIDHAHVVGFLHCGHVATDGIGGKCTEPFCQNTSCPSCFARSRCSVCFKGLCLECRNEIELDGVVRVVCSRCQDEIQRQQRNRAVVRFLLFPFVDFKKSNS